MNKTIEIVIGAATDSNWFWRIEIDGKTVEDSPRNYSTYNDCCRSACAAFMTHNDRLNIKV